MQENRLLSLIRQAIDKYEMIDEGDKIAVGISGGKDSLTLLYGLSKLKNFYPKSFELYAFTVDLGFENVDFCKIKAFCDDLGVEYQIIKTDIASIVFDIRKEQNPCSLCAKMRKGALNARLKELEINKIAYAHHKDDVVDTLLLSLIYEGRFNTINPVTYLDRDKITVLRPLIYVKESEVKGFVNKYEIPVLKSPCPVDKKTKREYVKKVLSEINKCAPGVSNRIFTAIETVNFFAGKDKR
jgi:tRNA(Ile)-lysidine synthase TilS/MesJ